MSKDAYWFKHDSNARHDQRLMAIRVKYGMRGYGIYFGIIEMLREAYASRLPSRFDLVAFDLREPLADVEDIINSYGLFTVADGNFFSESLLRRMEKREEVLETKRVAGRKGGLAKARAYAKIMPKHNVAIRIEENRRDKSIFTPPTLEEVTTYTKEIGSSINPKYFIDSNTAKGWVVGKNRTPMKDWKATIRTWSHNQEPKNADKRKFIN